MEQMERPRWEIIEAAHHSAVRAVVVVSMVMGGIVGAAISAVLLC